jgi:hypothetical protein
VSHHQPQNRLGTVTPQLRPNRHRVIWDETGSWRTCLTTLDGRRRGDGVGWLWSYSTRRFDVAPERGTSTLSCSSNLIFECSEDSVAVLIIVLLVIWLIAAVIGFAFEGLLWLAIIAIILFVGTAAIGFVRRNAIRR